MAVKHGGEPMTMHRELLAIKENGIVCAGSDLWLIYQIKGAIIFIEVCVCVLRTLIILSGCVEKTVLVGGSGLIVHIFCVLHVYTLIFTISHLHLLA